MPTPPFVRTILVCCNERDPGKDACGARGSASLHQTLKTAVKDRGLQKRIRVVRSGCLDLCSIGPNVCIMPENVWYHDVKESDLPALIDRWIAPLETGSTK